MTPPIGASLRVLHGSGDVVTVLDDFEDGDASEWSGVIIASSSRANSGSYSGYASSGTDYDDSTRTLTSGGSQPNKFKFHWNEPGSNTGYALTFYNSNGNRELSVGTNNPQWVAQDGNYNEFYSGDGYDRWIEFVVTFDWSSGAYTVDGTDLSSGSTSSDSGNLINGTDVEVIATGYAGWGGGSGEWYIDDLET